MIQSRAVFKILCAVFCILIPISCGEDVTTPIDCGDSATVTAPPAVPSFGGYPPQTHKTPITLFGTKSKNTSIAININNAGAYEAVSFDCLTTWAADVTLSDGANTIELFSINRTGGRSSSTTISITKQSLTIPPFIKVARLLCDINGDGFDDVVVGSYENDAGGKNAGRVFIYHGGAGGPDTTADVVLTGEAAEDRFGISVGCAGDVNNDGYADVTVGAFFNDAGGQDAGRAYIYFGGNNTDANLNNDMDDVPDVVLTGQVADDQFGTSVSMAGDVNGDGYDDVIVGAYRNDGGGANAGRAYIYYGGSSIDNLPDVVLTGEATGDQLGIRVAWAGDVNGDAYDDVIVGADRADVGSLIDAGKAYIFFGNRYMAGQNARQADVILQGTIQDEAFASVARAGNLNGDAYDDVVVGGSSYTAGSGSEICDDFIDNDNDRFVDRRDPDCYRGRAYVFLGGPIATGTIISANNANFILQRPSEADGFGFSVAAAGDVDGDSFGDLLVGAFLSDRIAAVEGSGTCTDSFDNDGDTLTDFDDSDCLIEDQGRAYLYRGGSTFDPNPDVTFIGEASPGVAPNYIPLSGQFGFALSGAGKLNSGNLSDIVIGAYLHDTGIRATETDVGRAYIFLGQSFSSTIQASDACALATLGRCFTGSESGPLGPDSGFGVSVQ